MKKVKIYQSIQFTHLSYSLEVNGKSLFLEFIGGHEAPRRRCGTYSTDDPDIQKAMDESSDNGVLFKCIVGDEPVKKVQPEVQDKTPEPPKEEPKDEVATTDPTTDEQPQESVPETDADPASLKLKAASVVAGSINSENVTQYSAPTSTSVAESVG